MILSIMVLWVLLSLAFVALVSGSSDTNGDD